MSAKPMIIAVRIPTCALGTNGEKIKIGKPATSTTVVVSGARPVVSNSN